MRASIALFVVVVGALACGGDARDEAFDKGTEPKTKAAETTKAAPTVEPTPELDGLLKEDPVYLHSAERNTVACSGTVRKREDLSYRVDLFKASGEHQGDQVQLRPTERDFPARRKALDEQLRSGFVALPRTAWPTHGREMEIPGGDKKIQWTEDGGLAVLEKGKPIHTKVLSRKDMVPIAIHVGPSFVAVQVSFDPKDENAADASYTECVVLPTGAK